MLKRATARSSQGGGCARGDGRAAKPASPILTAADQPQAPDEVVERVRLKVTNAHVFKLPPKPSAGGWRGAEWRDKVWQGTLKVVERGEETAVLLGGQQRKRKTSLRCARYGTIWTGKQTWGTASIGASIRRGTSCCASRTRRGGTCSSGLAFNERNDAFDFNTALEDSRREKELERRAAALGGGAGAAQRPGAMWITR